MNTTTAEKIAVMQAHGDGATIEFCRHYDETWRGASTPLWDWSFKSYRVKPHKPKVSYSILERGILYRHYSCKYDAERALQEACFSDDVRVVKLREVLGDE